MLFTACSPGRRHSVPMHFRTTLQTARSPRLPACILAFGLLVLAIGQAVPIRPAQAAVPPQYVKIDRLVLPVIRREASSGSSSYTSSAWRDSASEIVPMGQR